MSTPEARRSEVNDRAAATLLKITEEELGECVRSACNALGWRFLWLRHLSNSAEGILDLQLIPLRHQDRRHTLHRELKGYDRNGRLGKLTSEQAETIHALNAAGDDARKWDPGDWTSGQILEELK
jgi:hypothetical protein